MELINTWRWYFLTHDVLNRNVSALKSSWSVTSSLDSRFKFFAANSDIIIIIISSIS